MCLVAVLLVEFLFTTATCSLRTDQQFWKDQANTELEEALQIKWNLNKAKNVIIFIGDGMGPNTVTATRIYKGGESHRLVYEKFPHMGLLKTYSADKTVPDSACSATALFTGVKTNKNTIGVDARVQRKDCSSSLLEETRLRSLADDALDLGKSAGFVTTMRVTHATPGPLYAHSADRTWECETKMPTEAAQCKDIARQLVEDEPGKNLHVIMGGGRSGLTTNLNQSANPWACSRADGRDLIEDYKKDKSSRGLKYGVAFNNKELKMIDVDNTDYLLGIFADSHLSYEYERNNGSDGMPSISEMVEAAIRVLKRNDKGYFLMVEGGNIDMAHHRGRAKVAVDEAAALEEAVKVALSLTDQEDTLVILTSDHTHTLAINGYPTRGSDIFGIAEPSSYDGTNYTTLSYSTGGPESFQFYSSVDENNETIVKRRDPSHEDTTSVDYKQVAAIRLIENSHGGGDVAIYAIGPQAHLFHNVHEQHYVYRVIKYAMMNAAETSFHAASFILLIFVSSIIACAGFLY